MILVDDADREIGVAEKLAAHREGDLHRAFSIFVWDDKERLLLQQRAATKYHSPLLWSNTCCGHPRPGETVVEAAHRRLMEEMGIDCSLTVVSVFTYRASLEGNLVEHEIDHVLTGTHTGDPRPNPEEVAAWMWVTREELALSLKEKPESYTAWFGQALAKIFP